MSEILLVIDRNVSCEGCGACCTHLTMPPFDSYDEDDLDFERLPDALKRELEEKWDVTFGDRRHEFEGRLPNSIGGPCSWFDLETKRCRNYEHRPVCCREFVPGNDICLEDREAEGVK